MLLPIKMNWHQVPLREWKKALMVLLLAGIALVPARGDAASIYIGDDAAQGASITSGTGQDSSLATYAFVQLGTSYTATSNLQLQVSEVNFFAGTATGSITPFLAIYSGDQTSASIKTGSNYDVILIGDSISVTGNSGLHDTTFLVGGTTPTISLSTGQVLVSGFTTSVAGLVKYNGTATGTIDYVTLNSALPTSTPNPLTASATLALDRTLQFDVGLNTVAVPEPATYFLVGMGVAALAWGRLRRHRRQAA
jgi:hypothetical protein